MGAVWSPSLILILGALALALLRGRARGVFAVALPLAGLLYVLRIPAGEFGQFEMLGQSLTLVRVDRLSRVFGIVFMIAALLNTIYSLNVKDRIQLVSGLLYAGSAIGAAFAGDLITLFVFWELAAVTSVFLIWASRTPKAAAAGMRYLILQLVSGVVLLAGIVLHANTTGSIRFDHLGLEGTGTLGLGHQLIFLAFGIKCAFPVLHTWLTDAYPEATAGGTVFLSSFTTKMAVYALARGFAGTEILLWVGVLMAVFPIFFAVIENDLRRVLGYSMINQLGFMVVGVGIGTELSLNGTAAHAFADILFKGLLFMAMGAVLHRTGTTNGSELGGLYKSMPLTTIFCIVGAASISAFPLFSAFATKSMIMSAVAERGDLGAWLLLLFASAGVFHHAGIKIPYFAFFSHDSGIRVREAPGNMLVAMAIAAALCIGIGVYPDPLYALLPFPVDYVPYTATHVIAQVQLLLFAALAFATLVRTGLYPPELRSVNLDVDWLYRKAAPSVVHAAARVGQRITRGVQAVTGRALGRLLGEVQRLYSPAGRLGEPWPTGTTALWAALLLCLYLILWLL